MGPAPILEMARAYGLRPRLWLLAILVTGDHTVDVQNECPMCCKPRLQDLLGIAWMATTLSDNIVIVIGRTRPRSMSLATLTMKKGLHGFLFLCMYVVLFLQLWCFANKGDK